LELHKEYSVFKKGDGNNDKKEERMEYIFQHLIFKDAYQYREVTWIMFLDQVVNRIDLENRKTDS
jgi:hypothetical protein